MRRDPSVSRLPVGVLRHGRSAARRLAGVGRAVMVLYWAGCLAVIGYGADRLRPEWREQVTAEVDAATLAMPFPNCSVAHAAGVYNIPEGSPRYRPQQDGDGDGLACEPAPPRGLDW
jgi:hypothetical protein